MGAWGLHSPSRGSGGLRLSVPRPWPSGRGQAGPGIKGQGLNQDRAVEPPGAAQREGLGEPPGGRTRGPWGRAEAWRGSSEPCPMRPWAAPELHPFTVNWRSRKGQKGAGDGRLVCVWGTWRCLQGHSVCDRLSGRVPGRCGAWLGVGETPPTRELGAQSDTLRPRGLEASEVPSGSFPNLPGTRLLRALVPWLFLDKVDP